MLAKIIKKTLEVIKAGAKVIAEGIRGSERVGKGAYKKGRKLS